MLTHFARQCGCPSRDNVKISRARWFKMIQSIPIPPSALELLHDNNSDSGSRCCPCTSQIVDVSDRLRAIEYGLKPPGWNNEDQFMYARHDSHLSQNIFLCAIAQSVSMVEEVMTKFERGHGIYPNRNPMLRDAHLILGRSMNQRESTSMCCYESLVSSPRRHRSLLAMLVNQSVSARREMS